MRGFFRRGKGLTQRNSLKICICPDCGHIENYTRGIPCTEKKCPECGATMKGKFCL